jgi:2-polyprenyl-6-methoxyphenol hydroxylase-like FAD-dependent oxidoreductase
VTGTAGSERLIVAGSGIAGLALALAAGRQGHEVVLLERDPAPHADSPEAAFATSRRGAPHAHQTHGFLARLTLVLRQRFPDVLDALLDAGARALPLTRDLGDPLPGDEDLAILALRRTTLEWVLRRMALAEPHVEIRSGVAVAGVVAEPDGGGGAAGGGAGGAGGAAVDGDVSRVVGVRLAGGSVLDAGVVAACTGRRGDVPGWLGEVGVDIPETVHDTHLVYLTRWYRWRDGHLPTLPPRLGRDLGYLKYLAVPCDGSTFSVTVAVAARDGELRSHLSRPDVFDRTCRLLPGPDELLRQAPVEAIGPILPMGGLVNRLRRFLHPDGRPRVLGFHAVGDAHTCTNPLYGRGCALGFVQATLLADALAAHPGDPVAQAVAYETASAREVEPWFHAAVQMDQLRPAERRSDGGSGADGDEAPGDGGPDGADGGDGRGAGVAGGRPAENPGTVFARLAVEGGTDPIIGRGLIRLFNLLVTPADLMADAAFMARALPIVTQTDPAPLPAPEGPQRQELLAL